ncbi:site-specific DNA-methyltransferase [Campylobacter jejuni]|nr:site-specific DNA-methyltransferase [Campylobacter jejuni]
MSDYKIYNCDCIEFMKDMVNQGKKVDCIITDPPYLYLNHKLDRQFSEELFFELAGKITNKLVFFGRGDSFYKWNLLAKEQGFQFKEEIIWNKKHTTSPFHKLGRAHETISVRMKYGYIINKVKIDALRKHFNEDDFYALINDLKRVFSSVKNSDVIKDYLEKGICILELNKSKHSLTTDKILKKVDRSIKTIDKYKEGTILSSIITENREHYTMEHPTQKPIKLLEKLVLLATNENETILDPFMGSGSTGLACLFKNRNFIGCEIDKDYFEIAERRLKSTQDTLKQNLFYGMDI